MACLGDEFLQPHFWKYLVCLAFSAMEVCNFAPPPPALHVLPFLRSSMTCVGE